MSIVHIYCTVIIIETELWHLYYVDISFKLETELWHL
jgi:hypothetical protein